MIELISQTRLTDLRIRASSRNTLKKESFAIQPDHEIFKFRGKKHSREILRFQLSKFSCFKVYYQICDNSKTLIY